MCLAASDQQVNSIFRYFYKLIKKYASASGARNITKWFYDLLTTVTAHKTYKLCMSSAVRRPPYLVVRITDVRNIYEPSLLPSSRFSFPFMQNYAENIKSEK